MDPKATVTAKEVELSKVTVSLMGRYQGSDKNTIRSCVLIRAIMNTHLKYCYCVCSLLRSTLWAQRNRACRWNFSWTNVRCLGFAMAEVQYVPPLYRLDLVVCLVRSAC